MNYLIYNSRTSDILITLNLSGWQKDAINSEIWQTLQKYVYHVTAYLTDSYITITIQTSLWHEICIIKTK